jgi:hypothetical protein
MNEEQYIVFDQYLQGELSREEQSLFEKNLIENQSWHRHSNFQRNTRTISK